MSCLKGIRPPHKNLAYIILPCHGTPFARPHNRELLTSQGQENMQFLGPCTSSRSIPSGSKNPEIPVPILLYVILVVADRFSKACKFIPSPKLSSAKDMGQLILHYVVCFHAETLWLITNNLLANFERHSEA